jgi:hypothetical protein
LLARQRWTFGFESNVYGPFVQDVAVDGAVALPPQEIIVDAHANTTAIANPRMIFM